MTGVYMAFRHLRFLWHSATWRDRAAVLVVAWFAGLTVVSMMYGSPLEMVTKLTWLLAFVVIMWGQVGAIVDRVVQTALTEEFVAQVAAETREFGDLRMSFEFAGMRHVFVSGQGWCKEGAR